MSTTPIKLVADTAGFQDSMRGAAQATRELMLSEKELATWIAAVRGQSEEKQRVLKAMGVTESEYTQALRMRNAAGKEGVKVLEEGGDGFKKFKGIAKESAEVLLNATDTTGQLSGVIRGAMNPAFLAAGVAALAVGAGVAAWREKQEAMQAVLTEGSKALQGYIEKMQKYVEEGGRLNAIDEQRLRNARLLYAEEHQKEMEAGNAEIMKIREKINWWNQAIATRKAQSSGTIEDERKVAEAVRERELAEAQLVAAGERNRRHLVAMGSLAAEADDQAARAAVERERKAGDAILKGRIAVFDEETAARKKFILENTIDDHERYARILEFTRSREAQRGQIIIEERRKAEEAAKKAIVKVDLGQADFGHGQGLQVRLDNERKYKEEVLDIQASRLRLEAKNEDQYTLGYIRNLRERQRLYAVGSKEELGVAIQIRNEEQKVLNARKVAYEKLEQARVASRRKAESAMVQLTQMSNNRMIRALGAVVQIFQAYEVMKTEIKAIQEASRTAMAAQGAATGMAMEATKSSAEIGVSTATGAQKSYSAMAGIPYIGPILGFAAAAAAIIYGQQQAAKAKSEAAKFQAHSGNDNTRSGTYNLTAGEMVLDPLAGSTGRALVDLARKGADQPRNRGGKSIVLNISGNVYGGRAGVKQLAKAVRSASAYGVR